MALTKHAKDRIQQRGIPALALTLLQEFGLEEYSRGSVIPTSIKNRSRRPYLR